MSMHTNTLDHTDTLMPINAAHVDADEYECYLNAVVSSPPSEAIS